VSDRVALDLLEAALEQGDAERSAWLAARCGDNPALRERVERLLALDAAAEASDPGASVRPPARIGPWRLAELIGSGGMGSVWCAWRDDGLFEQQVAIKFIRGFGRLVEARALIDAERRLLARMSHPSIARILDGGTTEDGQHYLVMEYVEGEALDRFVASHRPALAERVALLRRICDAVGHAHGLGVLHNDLKPANVLVAADGLPKLIDFGVARLADRIDTALPQGYTRAYASPQRQDGEAPTVADEVYSLGRMLAELLDDSADPELRAVIRRATAEAREDRYPTVAAFDDELRRWQARLPLAAAGTSAAYRARKLVQRHPWRVAGGVLAGAGLLVALLVMALLFGRAEDARRDAEARFAQLRSLAGWMLFELDTRLESVPGNTDARREMVGRAQQYLDGLAATAGGDAALQQEVAVGLARLAEVQGVPGRPNVGEAAAADRNLERAEAMLAALGAARPPAWALQRDLGSARYLRAITLGRSPSGAERQLAKAREAEQDLQRAIAAASAAAVKDRAELEVTLLGARLVQAEALRWLQRHSEAAQITAAEEARIGALAEPLRRAIDVDAQLARPATMLGDSLFYLDRLPDALEAYRRGAAAFERVLQRRPLERRALEGSVIAAWNIAGTLAEMTRFDESVAVIERALPTADRLVALDPRNREAKRLRHLLTGQQAISLAGLGRYDTAIRLVEDDLAEKERYAAGRVDDGEAVRDTAVALRNLADMYQRKGDGAGACRVLRLARERWGAIEQRFGLSPSDRRDELEVVGDRLRGCPG
jgi:serine/threonine-protein kinase